MAVLATVMGCQTGRLAYTSLILWFAKAANSYQLSLMGSILLGDSPQRRKERAKLSETDLSEKLQRRLRFQMLPDSK